MHELSNKTIANRLKGIIGYNFHSRFNNDEGVVGIEIQYALWCADILICRNYKGKKELWEFEIKVSVQDLLCELKDGAKSFKHSSNKCLQLDRFVFVLFNPDGRFSKEIMKKIPQEYGIYEVYNQYPFKFRYLRIPTLNKDRIYTKFDKETKKIIIRNMFYHLFNYYSRYKNET